MNSTATGLTGRTTTLIDEWNGRRATALRYAMRMSQETFAEHLGIAARTVAKWAAAPASVLQPETQRILDTAYERLTDGEHDRFKASLTSTTVVSTWDGRHAAALQAALRMTHDEFAEHLGVSRRTVINWRAKPECRMRPEMQRALDTAFARLSESQRIRFTHELDRVQVQPEPDAETTADEPGFIGISFAGGQPRIVLQFDGGHRMTLTPHESEQLARAMLSAVELGRGVRVVAA
ncbi:helix-turn-helix domain-containing protein [Nonomuraea angiospora]|uniref:helix-turn-helix domain-containing protein n=1 Tax=Nonomuraea angiospora TaxID=46172 RepID=UPI0033C311C2